MKIKFKQKFLCYTIMYVHIPYYTKIKSKRKFKIQNIKLSKISLPTVLYNMGFNWFLSRTLMMVAKQ